MTLRYALIEDEPPARARLKRLVAELDPTAECVAEAEDGLSGLALLETAGLDLLFLDIEFPPEGAFGLLRRAREAGLTLPPIAFVTAFDQHALEAFRWAACDYLLKPVARERLAETLSRIQPQRAGLDLGLLLQALEGHAAQGDAGAVHGAGEGPDPGPGLGAGDPPPHGEPAALRPHPGGPLGPGPDPR